jgi:hypothetical protein
MSEPKRWMLYVPEIEPNSFFFFFYKGDTGRSYSVRTYTSDTAKPRHRTQDDFDLTAAELLKLAQYREPVVKPNIKDVGNRRHWWAHTKHMNDKYLGGRAADSPQTIRRRPVVSPSAPSAESLFFSREGEPLVILSDWQDQHTPRHWRAGYSAMELARSWSAAEGFPQSFQRALDRPPFRGLVLERGVVEENTDVPGKGRASCTDLMVTARALDGTGVILGVEGKVDESFGELVSDWSAKGGANRQDRLDGLCEGLELDPARVGGLRYQLFHRCYAALATAREERCEHAIMAVHSLQGRGASGENWRDFVKFARAMGAAGVTSGRPVAVGERMGVRFWLMWVTEGRR